MSGSAYHWDALRKERILQRKREALRRLQNPDPVIDNTGRTKKREEPLVIADQGEFVNLRSRKANTCTNKMQIGALDSNILGADSGVVFENVTHDPNYKYRLHRHSCLPPVHVDPIYGLIYPGSFKYTASCSCRNGTVPDHRICHRKVNYLNVSEDKIYPILQPKQVNYRIPADQLPPRKPHFKV
ncbi:uncharacterized protein LOC121378333 isoform X4 [Gigantopelta aegis]|uniref:uncharacterized protein LOC121378333 isoform X4 n=1 Tax=Gigantopelta aegis TaxID=1735272 RepID=UPI001B88CA14|nr:uncharacterized protein LOC121378333 isoform X4 [Gigantopelta aegis]